MRESVLMVCLLFLVLLPGACSGNPSTVTSSTRVERSVDIWDWTPPARDLELFERWVADLHATGCNRVELSVPWNILETEQGRYDLTWLKERAAICRKHSMPMRLRINSYLFGGTPQWYVGDFLHDAQGEAVTVAKSRIPSISDDRFWDSYAPMCTAIARELQGQDVLYNAFVGTHAELKYGNWWTFDPSSLALWRQSIQHPRPDWLRHVVSVDIDLPTTPSVPAATSGSPDLSPESRAFIAFREWTWRNAVFKFNTAIREGDPNARISSPLGESYRRESALMGNLDYWGTSRGSQQIVHSYDFALHSGNAPLWHVTATIRSFQGITGLPVVFEFDAPGTLTTNGYTESIQKKVADVAAAAGAGLKFANFSYQTPLPSEWPVIAYSAKLTPAAFAPVKPTASKEGTVLLFFSKWATYSYREPTEWLHDAQFGWWKLLNDADIPTRIICEDNLGEDLSEYRGIVMAFAPPELLPESDHDRLANIGIPMISDYSTLPTRSPEAATTLDGPIGPFTLMPGLPFVSVSATMQIPDGAQALLRHEDSQFVIHNVANRTTYLGFPLGYYYLHSDADPCRELLQKLLIEFKRSK